MVVVVEELTLEVLVVEQAEEVQAVHMETAATVLQIPVAVEAVDQTLKVALVDQA